MHKLLLFKDEKLLYRSLTHRSYINENPQELGDNERLEFLGDAILNFLSGEYLYQCHPEMGEDEMTRRRSALVDEKQLARFAVEVGLASRMRLGQGAIQQGGYQNPNLLSSTFEAVIGAYYLDHDQDIGTLRALVRQLFDSVPDDLMEVRASKDPKSQLQEFVQANGVVVPPRYVTEKLDGADHAPEFYAKVFVNHQLDGDDKVYGEGKGRSKKDAEKQAAENALDKLKQRGLL
jgi:ribonuclease III